MKYLPNILTVSRIVLAALFVVVLSNNTLSSVMAALVIFLLAALTDYYDGYFAKKQNKVSDFGKIMDPIADKFLILAAFYIFVQLRLVAQWMLVVILIREVVITAIRICAVFGGKVLAAERAGKIKTVSQMTAIFLLLLTMILRLSGFILQWPPQAVYTWAFLVIVALWAAVILTVSSGIMYLWNIGKEKYA